MQLVLDAFPAAVFERERDGNPPLFNLARHGVWEDEKELKKALAIVALASPKAIFTAYSHRKDNYRFCYAGG